MKLAQQHATSPPTPGPALRAVALTEVPEGGFHVSIHQDTAGYILRAGGLEIHCDDAETARALFDMAKSPGSRIRVERCGKRPVSFTLEIPLADGGYRSVASSGSGGLLAMFRTRTVTYLQNRLSEQALARPRF